MYGAGGCWPCNGVSRRIASAGATRSRARSNWRAASATGGARVLRWRIARRLRRAPGRRRVALRRDLLERAPALDGLGLRALRVATRVGALVAPLDQQPLRLGAAAARAMQRPAPAQLRPLQPDLRVTGGERFGHRALLVEVAVGAGVPHDHRARPVARADHALEVRVLE